MVRLLEDTELIQIELNRRLETAPETYPSQRRLEILNHGLIKVLNNIERLLTAYQEELLPFNAPQKVYKTVYYPIVDMFYPCQILCLTYIINC